MKIHKYVLPFIALGPLMSPVWAADEAVIENLQTDVSVTKSKTDKNAQDINDLKGGLPAVESRVAALEAALHAADGTISQLQEDLATAIAQIGQLQTDLNVEVAARQSADSELNTAYMAADGNLQAQIDILSAVDVGALESRLYDVEETLTCVTYDTITMDLIFVGCNVHVRDGTGLTQGTSGLGNLIIGYNTDVMALLNRYGSHNVIIGDEQTYTGSGQLLTQFLGSSQDLYVTIGKDLNENISLNRNITIGKDSNLNVGLNRNTSIGQNLSVDAGQNMNLSGGDMLDLTTGAASIAMQNNGAVSIQGKDIRVVGSGKIDVKAAGVLALKGSSITQN